jgi:hypothetical protein
LIGRDHAGAGQTIQFAEADIAFQMRLAVSNEFGRKHMHVGVNQAKVAARTDWTAFAHSNLLRVRQRP